MEQLSATDSQMLFIETNESPNLLGPLMIYDPSTATLPRTESSMAARSH